MQMKRMTRRAVAVLGLQLVFSAFAAGGQDSRPLRSRIPKGNPSQCFGVQESSDWKNPYLVVYADGIHIVGVTVAEYHVPVDTVPAFLERLPDSAWPCGLIVAVQDESIEAYGDGPRVEANRTKLLKLLGNLGIEVDGWPA
jgi:hypothetical protein